MGVGGWGGGGGADLPISVLGHSSRLTISRFLLAKNHNGHNKYWLYWSFCVWVFSVFSTQTSTVAK